MPLMHSSMARITPEIAPLYVFRHRYAEMMMMSLRPAFQSHEPSFLMATPFAFTRFRATQRCCRAGR